MTSASFGKTIAYFSMEVGLEDPIATYSGGLGVLAGDTLKAAADVGLAMVGVTLLHHKGYLRQVLAADGTQTAEPVDWDPEEHLEGLTARATVEIEGRTVTLGAWRYVITGVHGSKVPVIFLDADLPDNDERDRNLTDRLYGGDERYRLAQEIILGIGGRRMLAALGYAPDVFHLNEGHAALAALELLVERTRGGRSVAEAIESIRGACVFTTHTPVPAGHDRFPVALYTELLEPGHVAMLERIPELALQAKDAELNMTELCLQLAGFVNGVAEIHAEVSRGMFPGKTIHAVTNGVHHPTWCSPAFAKLFDRRIPGWRADGARLRLAQGIPGYELLAAHREAKRALVAEVVKAGHREFSSDVLTLGFARRATPYKRASLLFHDVDRLIAIAERFGGLQVVYAGKAHPKDAGGQALIQEIHAFAEKVAPHVRLAYLPDYGMRLGALITGGVDVWLNNPRAPMEASGTSGMKAVLNGVPNLSIRDGWWGEGAIEGVTGWVVEPTEVPADLLEGVRTAEEKLVKVLGTGKAPSKPSPAMKSAEAELEVASAAAERFVDAADAAKFHALLEDVVLPLYEGEPSGWAKLMRGAISLAASYFHAQRMVEQYRDWAYHRGMPPA
jgi:glycogen phosphorylase